MSVGVVWLVAVAVTWVATAVLLAVLINAIGSGASAGHVIGQAAASATLACVVVAGPATAVALRVNRRHRRHRAALSGVGTAALILLFFWSFMTATGAPLQWAWQTLVPLVIVTGAQLALALALRRRCRDAPPQQVPPGQAGPGQAEPA
jgi:peptidoglycan/LPS O-acetylase OafA/YrhL